MRYAIRDVGMSQPERMFVTIRSTDSNRVPDISIRLRGRLFGSLGVVKDTYGSLRLEGDGGTARGMLDGELSTESGELVFSAGILGPELELAVWPTSGAAVPRLTAKGRTVRVIRQPTGTLMVKSGF